MGSWDEPQKRTMIRTSDYAHHTTAKQLIAMQGDGILL